MRILSTFLVLAFALAGVTPVLAVDYRLSAQDRIRVKVVEWRPADNEQREWSTLGGDYTVGPDGTVAIPLVGSLVAEGKTPHELSDAISTALQQRIGLIDPPDAVVEIIAFRPVYILGGVASPGEYQYRPGLTVLQAIGVAGGLFRGAQGGGDQRIGREMVSVVGEMDVLRVQQQRLLARTARLQTELAGETGIATPAGLDAGDLGQRLMRDEAAILDARAAALDQQLGAIADLKTILTQEVATLEQKVVALDGQLDAANEQLTNVTGLVSRGLAVSERQLNLQRLVSDLTTQRLDLQTAMPRARQDISDADRDAIGIRSDSRSRQLVDLQEAQNTLDQVTVRLGTQRQLLAEVAVVAPAGAVQANADAIGMTVYSVVRRTATGQSEFPVDEATLVEPGDVVRVGTQLAVPSAASGGAGVNPATPVGRQAAATALDGAAGVGLSAVAR